MAGDCPNLKKTEHSALGSKGWRAATCAAWHEAPSASETSRWGQANCPGSSSSRVGRSEMLYCAADKTEMVMN